jgi:uncharacterized protein (DUF697 family)
MRKIRKTKQKDDANRQPMAGGMIAPFPAEKAAPAAAMVVGDKAELRERVLNLGAICHAAPRLVTVEAEPFGTAAAPASRSRFPEEVRVRAREAVMDNTLIASGVGLVPVLLVDIAGTALIIGGMLKNISKLYGCRDATWPKNAGLSLLAAAGSVGGGEILAGLLSRLIPGAGLMLAAASLPMSMGVVTYSLGMAAVRHFEANGSAPPTLSALARDARGSRAESEARVSALIGRIGTGAKA